MTSIARGCLIGLISMACATVALPQTTSRQKRRVPARKVTAKPQPTSETPPEGSPDTVSPEGV
ncbi:MAG: hypothetical protein M3R69_04155 [Acidobacteriota bacterium]|nr:hypothetical protein [Acidobacteriota bacterium]